MKEFGPALGRAIVSSNPHIPHNGIRDHLQAHIVPKPYQDNGQGLGT